MNLKFIPTDITLLSERFVAPELVEHAVRPGSYEAVIEIKTENHCNVCGAKQG